MSEGRQLALDTGCKYIEVSCTFSMNIDVLLAGIASQLGRKNKSNSNMLRGSKNGGKNLLTLELVTIRTC